MDIFPRSAYFFLIACFAFSSFSLDLGMSTHPGIQVWSFLSQNQQITTFTSITGHVNAIHVAKDRP